MAEVKSGDKFAMWTVVEDGHRNNRRQKCLLCVCDCGQKQIIATAHLLAGKTSSCRGCIYKRRKPTTKLDERYGRWTTSDEFKKTRNGLKCKCTCDCGAVKFVYCGNLKKGLSRQCLRCLCDSNRKTKKA
jgi:hypothetical protein